MHCSTLPRKIVCGEEGDAWGFSHSFFRMCDGERGRLVLVMYYYMYSASHLVYGVMHSCNFGT